MKEKQQREQEKCSKNDEKLPWWKLALVYATSRVADKALDKLIDRAFKNR